MSTTVETPWGPHRATDASGAHVLDPRTLKLRHFVTPGYGNPWCYVFNSWGQGIVGDGTGAQQHWDSPLSGAKTSGRRGMDADLRQRRACGRPSAASFSSRGTFPTTCRGSSSYACVINMNGIPRFAVHDDSAGFSGHRIKRSAENDRGQPRQVPDDLLASTDKNFRPVDPQIGPDGALWFGDWCNALIGHMQYSQRDPESRSSARPRLPAGVHGPAAAGAGHAIRQERSGAAGAASRVRTAHAFSGPPRTARSADGGR